MNDGVRTPTVAALADPCDGGAPAPCAGSHAPVGADQEVRWLSEEEQQAWLGAAAMLFTLPGALDTQLQRDAGLGLFEYLVLSQLSMADRRMLRMSQLADLANGSLSRLSNVVKRLEQRGWVRRSPDPTDGRYTVAVLTDAGWDTVVAAAPGHVAAVRHYLLTPLTRTQVRQLTDIGHRVRDRIQHSPLTLSPDGNCGESPPPC